MSVGCYHCGEAIPAGADFTVLVDGGQKSVCCQGCQAVAECILGAGLDDYYRLRSAAAVTPGSGSDDYSRFDSDALIEEFSQKDGQYWISRFSVGGLRCAACAWLIEHHLQGIDGVESINVHLQNAVATVKWNPDLLKPSALFTAFNALGYQALPWSAANRDVQLQEEMDGLLRRLGIAGIGMMQVGMVAIGLYAGDFQGIDSSTRTLLRLFSLLITTPVLLYSAQPFFKNAWRSIRHMHLGMDVPVSIALSAAYIASVIATLRQGEHVYYDTISMFTFFLLLSRYLQLRVSQYQHRGTALPMSARKIAQLGSSRSEWVAVKSLAVGDLISVHPGETIAVDGIIRRGQSSVESSAFSGEFLPTHCGPNDAVMAGSSNLDGTLEIEVSAVAADTAWTKITQLLEQAQSSKPAIAQLADRIASHFVSLVLLISGLSFAYWYGRDNGLAFTIMLSVLVVSCPCALSLATPASYTAAIKSLGKHGILLTNGRVLEQLRNVTHLIFDKTGTLTEGRPHIISCRLFGDIDEHTARRIAAALEAPSRHPIAHAFKRNEKIDVALNVENSELISGAGIRGTINGCHYRIGSAAFCGVAPKHNSSHLNVYLADEKRVLAHFQLADEIRHDALELVQNVQRAGLHIDILSGDNSGQVAEIAGMLNIENYQAGCSAAQKLAHVKKLQADGAIVMMVGDGVNDAPVIAAADISIAMSSASELTRTQADVVLLDNQLQSISTLFSKAQQSRRVLLQNLSWALLYNLLALPLAAMGLVPPWLAALGMSLSSLLVVLNALRIGASHTDSEPRATSTEPKEIKTLATNGVRHG
ncbi:heavy metal translocating P-type ATPase [Zhongshania sp.]|jgi:Cu2+-exporting ATPase|uniref:heavy metal translocating P-type ATPase n=1 Tax=Zhongshania sp. TaxID=1971902 RepID=UPI001B516B50|nr:heavy metal translocating P-type ATPase [Zhongshania sp.]MBQ0796902.1 cadmium-translocating P-type ATPase [Zhongshania sp.]